MTTANRRWHIAVVRRDFTFNMYILAPFARDAVEEVLRRIVFEGSDIIGISVTEDPV